MTRISALPILVLLTLASFATSCGVSTAVDTQQAPTWTVTPTTVVDEVEASEASRRQVALPRATSGYATAGVTPLEAVALWPQEEAAACFYNALVTAGAEFGPYVRGESLVVVPRVGVVDFVGELSEYVSRAVTSCPGIDGGATLPTLVGSDAFDYAQETAIALVSAETSNWEAPLMAARPSFVACASRELQGDLSNADQGAQADAVTTCTLEGIADTQGGPAVVAQARSCVADAIAAAGSTAVLHPVLPAFVSGAAPLGVGIACINEWNEYDALVQEVRVTEAQEDSSPTTSTDPVEPVFEYGDPDTSDAVVLDNNSAFTLCLIGQLPDPGSLTQSALESANRYAARTCLLAVIETTPEYQTVVEAAHACVQATATQEGLAVNIHPVLPELVDATVYLPSALVVACLDEWDAYQGVRKEIALS